MKRPCHHIPNTYYISAFFREPELWDNRLFFFWGTLRPLGKSQPNRNKPHVNLSRILYWMCVGISHSIRTTMHETITSHWRNTLRPFFPSQNSGLKTQETWCEEEVTNKCPLICFTVKTLELIPKCFVSVFRQYYETCCNSHSSNKTSNFSWILG